MSPQLLPEISFAKIRSVKDLDARALLVGAVESTGADKEPSAGSRGKDAKETINGATKQTIEPCKSVRALKDFAPVFDGFKNLGFFSGSWGSAASMLHQKFLPEVDHLIAFGCGKTSDFFPLNVLSLGGRIAQEIKQLKLDKVDLFIDSFFNPPSSATAADAPRDYAGRPALVRNMSREEHLEKLITGILLGSYRFEGYKLSKEKSKKDAKACQIRLVSTVLDGRKVAQIISRVEALAQGATLVRDLQTMPGNHLPPAEIAKRAQAAGRDAGVNVSVWDLKKLKSEGMGGIIAVGQGSAEEPRFVVMEYNASKKNLPLVVFVGKGISFDTGGISIKPAGGMHEMKMDMSGSAAVIGAICTLARLKAPVRVVTLVASAENMPSGTAIKPGDVYTAYSGHSVEVLNTDAEGRLVLADALHYAKSLKPDCVIDVATLTGAVTIALGSLQTGMMGNNAALLEGFTRASNVAGERVWELPLFNEYIDEMKSPIADIKNISDDRGAGSQKGGAFLSFFVDGAYPWIHLDVAATADTPKGQGAHCPKDVGTGVPMRSLVEFAENFADYFSKPKTKAKTK